MKFVRFGGGRTGVIIGTHDDAVLDLAAAVREDPRDTTAPLQRVIPEAGGSWAPMIDSWETVRPALTNLIEAPESADIRSRHSTSLARAALEPPLPDRGARIFAMGGNFSAHLGSTMQAAVGLPASIADVGAGGAPPWGFTVLPGTFVTSGGTVRRPLGAQKLDYEAEVAVILRGTIGPLDPGAPAVWGYTSWNDFSVRDRALGLAQEDHGPLTWAIGKNFDTGNAVGSWVVVDEGNVDDLPITCTVNGEPRQSGTTAEMTFTFTDIANYLARRLTLRSGDMLLSGTPGGTAIEKGIDGPFLVAGDIIDVDVAGIPTLRNQISDGAPD